MLVILSPAKTQKFDIKTKLDSSLPEFQQESFKLITELKKLSAKEIAKLMQLSPKLAELNYHRFQSYSKNFKGVDSLQAIYAYQGDVYQNLKLDTYSKSDFIFANSHVRILSGLYAYLRPLDLIQPYRLEMSTKLKTSSAKNLYEFWGSQITKSINRDLHADDRVLINLASEEYASTISRKDIEGKMIDIVFKEKKGSSYKIIGLLSKRARGSMANWIIKNRVRKINDLYSFSESGYKYSKSNSTEEIFVYMRE